MDSRLEINLEVDQILKPALTNLEGTEMTSVNKYLIKKLKCEVDKQYGEVYEINSLCRNFLWSGPDCITPHALQFQELTPLYDYVFHGLCSSLGEHTKSLGHSVENCTHPDASDNQDDSTFHAGTTKGTYRMEKRIPPSQSQILRIKRKLQPTMIAKLHNTRRSMQIISAGRFWGVTRPYIINVHNVASDGNCGFRAVAAGLEKDSSHGWLSIREELIEELTTFKTEYMKVYGDEGDIKLILNVLGCRTSPCPPGCWFALPAMGHLVASKYQAVFVCISEDGAQTFVPLRSPPSSDDPKVIAIGHIDRVHFVSIKLKPGCPIPRPINVHTDREVAEKWVDLLKSRTDEFDAISGYQLSTQGEAEDDAIVIS